MLPASQIIYLEKQDQYAEHVAFLRNLIFTAHNNTKFLVTTA